MRELVREYQSVLVAMVSVCFVFAGLYLLLPVITNRTEKLKNNNTELEFLSSNNENVYQIKYLKGSRVYVKKNSEFRISDYIALTDENNNEINDYKYSLYVNGEKCKEFISNICGGYQLVVEIEYKNKQILSELLVIIEERI